MAYAIIAASGTQLRVEPGRFYDVNRLAIAEDESITLDQVLFVNNEGEVVVGHPLVEGASVQVTVMRHLRGRKIIVYKMKPKKKTRKKRGHRQELTRIMINSITLNGTVIEAISTAEVAAVEVLPPDIAKAAEIEAVAAIVNTAGDTIELTDDVNTDDINTTSDVDEKVDTPAPEAETVEETADTSQE